MSIEIIISIVGALSALTVAAVGAVMVNKNNNKLQIRKLKESHYISFFEALHNNAANNDEQSLEQYTYYRDKLLLVGCE